MKIVLNLVQDMASVIKENASATLDGLEKIVDPRYAHLIAQVMVNAIMEYVNVIRVSKANHALNTM
jgi:hypothetical protein